MRSRGDRWGKAGTAWHVAVGTDEVRRGSQGDVSRVAESTGTAWQSRYGDLGFYSVWWGSRG